MEEGWHAGSAQGEGATGEAKEPGRPCCPREALPSHACLVLDPQTMPSFLPAHPWGLPGEMCPPSLCDSRVTGCTMLGALDSPKFPVAQEGMLWVTFEQLRSCTSPQQ